MAEGVRIIRLTSRQAPDGTWSSGDVGVVPVSAARTLVRNGLARLADGEVLPPEEIETAAIEPGAAPAGERPRRGLMRLG